MITPIPAPASSTATGLARPTNPATGAGKPKMPLPIMLLTASATMLQRPMARTNSACEVLDAGCVITSLYHTDGVPHVPYSYLTHLECSATAERYDIGRLQ